MAMELLCVGPYLQRDSSNNSAANPTKKKKNELLRGKCPFCHQNMKTAGRRGSNKEERTRIEGRRKK